MVTRDKSLRNYFIIAFLIPIGATVLVTLKDGLQTGLVTNQLSVLALVVVMSMVHAPTIAVMIVAFRDEGFNGVKDLFRQLTYWRFKSKWYLRALLIFPLSILASLLLSLVLGWLTHFSYTGGQLLLVSVTLSAVETLLWNSAFDSVLLLVIAFLVTMNKDFCDFWKNGVIVGSEV